MSLLGFKASENFDALKEDKNFSEKTLHLSRYLTASDQINKKCTGKLRILDVACGPGYGSSIVAVQTNGVVIGADHDKKSVAYANKNYSSSSTSFIKADITKLPFPDNHFNAITCFETIEHIGNPLYKKTLQELFRVLKKDGLLFISSPNKFIMSILSKIGFNNLYHLYEFYPNELRKELQESGFKVDESWGQCCYFPITYALARLNRLTTEIYFSPQQLLAPELSSYFMFLCRKK